MAKAPLYHKPALARIARPFTAAARVPPQAGLQALADMAASAPATSHLQSLQTRADAHPLQRVKTTSQPIGEIGSPVSYAFLATIGKNANQVDMFNAARQSYFNNLTRGAGIFNALETKKALRTPTTNGAAKKQLHDTAYTTEVTPSSNQPGVSNVKTGGNGGEKIAYINLVNLGENSMGTRTNYADRDPNRAQGNDGQQPSFLNNSDVFWQQWNAVIDQTTQRNFLETNTRFERRKDRKRKQLSCITRAQISNRHTILTVQHALPDGESFSTDNGTNYRFSADSEEFLAILGTPNGRGVGFLLSDHYHEMEKQSFGSVTAKAGETSLFFDFE